MGQVRVGLLVLGCLAALAPAQAQVAYPQDPYRPDVGVTGPLVWNVGGTLLFPVSDSSKRSDIGGGFTVGLTYNLSEIFGAQFEYSANWSSLKTGGLSNIGIFGNGFLQYFNLNAVVRPFHHMGRSSFYLIGGGGLYYRSATVNRVTGTAIAPVCDPWLYYCSAVPVSTAAVIGSRSSWDWGVDAGLGFAFGLPPVRLYIESRYHYIFGPTFTDANGARRTADGQYIPLTLGVQF